jgi:hypothetical protein
LRSQRFGLSGKRIRMGQITRFDTAAHVIGDLLQKSHLGVSQVGLGLLRGHAPGGFSNQPSKMQAPRLNGRLGQLGVCINSCAACAALARQP